MHWTATLARRNTARRVIDDLACSGCGYNLRGMTTHDRCPECGRDVSESTYVLSSPDVVGNAIRSIGRTYLIWFVLAMGCFPFGAPRTRMAIIGLSIGIGMAVRLLALGELRYRGGLDAHPTCGSGVRWSWAMAISEAALLLCLAGVMFIRVPAGTPAANFQDALRPIVQLAWVASVMASFVVLGHLGRSLATLLGYDSIRFEFMIQRVLLLICPVAFVVIYLLANMLGAPAGAFPTALIVAFFIASMLLALVFVLGFTGMGHLANAVDLERGEKSTALEEDDDELFE